MNALNKQIKIVNIFVRLNKNTFWIFLFFLPFYIYMVDYENFHFWPVFVSVILNIFSPR